MIPLVWRHILRHLLQNKPKSLRTKNSSAHRLPTTSLYNVCRATLVSRMTYAAPAWYGFTKGFTKAADRSSLQAVLTKATRWGLNLKPAPQIVDLVNSADQKLFSKILSFSSHVLHSLLLPCQADGAQSAPPNAQ